MPGLADILLSLGGIVVAVTLVLVLQSRKRSHATDATELSGDRVCDHLRPVYELLLSRGHVVARVAQDHPNLPLEIHVRPAFDPKAVYDELKLAEPVFVSERNVLYCKEDWCELHPVR